MYTVGSGPRYMICVTLFWTFRVRFSYGSVLFDSRNVQKRATKSDTSGHCLVYNGNKYRIKYVLKKVLNV